MEFTDLQVSYVKVRALRKSKNWNEDIWEDSNDSENHELLTPIGLPLLLCFRLASPSLKILKQLLFIGIHSPLPSLITPRHTWESEPNRPWRSIRNLETLV